MRTLLVVYHSQSGSTARMVESALDGARDAAIDGVTVVVRDALAATAADVLAADAVLLGTPENFGYMSGALKVFLERIYYPCLEYTQGRPYALFIKAGNDGHGATTSVERILAGLRWRAVQPPLIVRGELTAADLDACRELGMTLAAGLEAGLF